MTFSCRIKRTGPMTSAASRQTISPKSWRLYLGAGRRKTWTDFPMDKFQQISETCYSPFFRTSMFLYLSLSLGIAPEELIFLQYIIWNWFLGETGHGASYFMAQGAIFPALLRTTIWQWPTWQSQTVRMATQNFCMGEICQFLVCCSPVKLRVRKILARFMEQ